ncbi:MAG TPA: hypothetical protein VL357_05280 [Rariglobus sp.]|jgi:Spy/CpxP family protein refolding chaperone|nr:hypothetical protein [Rariglobus sp.]
MKSFKLLLSLFALAAIAAAPVLRAEDTPPAPPAGAEHKGAHGDRLKMLAEKLSLTDDQKAKIAPILKDEMQALKALRDDTSIDKKDKHTKMMEIRKSHADQILAILTPDQQAKFKDMQERHKGGPDAPKPTT